MNNRRTIVLTTVGVVAMVILLLAATGAWAGPDELGPVAPRAPAAVVSDTISYQGRLLDSGGSPVDGTRTMDFRLYEDFSGGMPLWSQSRSVTVEDGLFNVNLSVDPAHFDGRALWLGVQVQGDAQEMTPRQPLLPVPYALSLRPGAGISGTLPGIPTLNIVSQGIGIHAETTSATDPRDPAIVGINLGDGPGVEGHSETGFGVHGVSVEGPGVFGASDIGSGGVFTSTFGHGLVVEGAGMHGLRIFEGVGGDYIHAGSVGDPVSDPDFLVRNDGEVRSDVGFNTPANDFAEMMAVEGDPIGYEPGDVLVVSAARNRAVGLSSTPYARAVIGVYSTAPGFVGGRPVSGDDPFDSIPVAVLGIVPCKVSAENGPIGRGDLLVTSSTPGHAMQAGDPPPGTILGKALEPLDADTGVILVLVTLQ